MIPALLRNTRLSWSAAVAVVLVVTAFALSMGRRYLEASYWVAHSAALRDALESTLAAMTEAESAGRGYLLTGDGSLLAPYFDARPALSARLAALDELTAGDAAQRARLAEVGRLVDEGLEELEANVGRGQDGPGGVEAGRLDRGRDLMSRLRALVSEMGADEQRRLDAHGREAERALEQTRRALGLGALLTVGIALGAFVRMRRDSRKLGEASEALAFSEARLRRLAEAAFEGVVVSEDGRVADGNAALAMMFGYPPFELAGLDVLELVAPEDRGRVRAYLDAGDERVYECKGRRRGGESFPIEIRGRALPWGERAVRVTAVRDITERKRAETELVRRAERLRALSIGDELTGLANRRGFLELAGERLAQADRSGQPAALFFIDLNGMKPINDRLGHDAGDRLLVDAATILRACFRVTDVLARLGGDEFVVLAPEAGPGEVAPLEARLRACVGAFNARGERPYRVSMSIGTSLYDPRRPHPIEGLLAEADGKMYARKRARRTSTTSSMLPADGAGADASFSLLDASAFAPPAAAEGLGAAAWPPASGVMKTAQGRAGAPAEPARIAAGAPPRPGVALGRIALCTPPRRPPSGRA